MNWWAPRKLRGPLAAQKRRRPEVLILGPRRFGAPVLIGADGQVWEMHPIQYTRAWRVSYRYMQEGRALIILSDSVWPLTITEVNEHIGAIGAAAVKDPARRAACLERALKGAKFAKKQIGRRPKGAD